MPDDRAYFYAEEKEKFLTEFRDHMAHLLAHYGQRMHKADLEAATKLLTEYDEWRKQK